MITECLKPLDVREVVLQLRPKLESLVSAELILDLPPAPCLVKAPRESLEYLIAEPTKNAVESLTTFGQIVVRVVIRDIAAVLPLRRGLLPAGRYVAVEITDNGSGISPDAIDHVFEPFFSTKNREVGVRALALVYAMAVNFGWYVDMESTTSEGTTFRLLVPTTP